MATITLPWPIQRQLETATARLFKPDHGHAVDFTRPAGEPALVAPDSVSWRVFKNPLVLFMGGIAAVILELAEARIRTAIWEQSSYRRDPLRRIRRTGLAAMITVYGARSMAEPMIAGVTRMHARVAGTTASGRSFSAADPELITWVHATAAYGFVQGFHRFARPLSEHDIDRYFMEGGVAARLYGSPHPPVSSAQIEALFDRTIGSLEPSHVIPTFLRMMSETRAFPLPFLRLQRLLVRASLEILPPAILRRLDLEGLALRRHERWVVACAAKLADRIVLAESPAVQACRRLGLPASYLFG